MSSYNSASVGPPRHGPGRPCAVRPPAAGQQHLLDEFDAEEALRRGGDDVLHYGAAVAADASAANYRMNLATRMWVDYNRHRTRSQTGRAGGAGSAWLSTQCRLVDLLSRGPKRYGSAILVRSLHVIGQRRALLEVVLFWQVW